MFVLIGAAFLLHALHAAEYFLRHPLAGTLFSDGRLYHEWAERIAGGDLLGPPEPFHHPPLYPYLLAVLYLGFGPHPALAAAFQVLLGTAALFVVWRLCRRLSSPLLASSLTAALALATGPAFFEVRLLPTTLAFGLAALALERLSSHRRPTALLAAGLAFGLLCAARPNQLLALAAVALALCWSAPPPRRWAAAVPFLLGALLALAPFLARNWIRSGEPVLLCDTGGVNLWFAHNEHAGVSFRTPDPRFGDVGRQSAVARALAEGYEGRSLSWREVQASYTRRALAFMRDHPRLELTRAAERLRAFFSPEALGIVHSIPAESGFLSSERLFFLPTSLFAAVGLAALFYVGRRSRRSRAALCLVAFAAAQAATAVLFFPYERFRVAALPALVPLGALFLHALLHGRPRGMRRAGAVLAAAFFILFGTSAPRYGREQEAAGLVTVAEALAARGRLDEALFRLDRADALAPGFARALLVRARLLRTAGRHDEAETLLRRALAAHGPHPLLLGELALLLARRGGDALEEARSLATRALDRNPVEPAAVEALATTLVLSGDLEGAVRTLSPVERWPDPPRRLLELLRDAYRRSGRAGDARRVSALLENR